MKKYLLLLLLFSLVSSIVSFLLGYWQVGMVIGGGFLFILTQVSQYYSVKNSEYVYSNRVQSNNKYKKYGD
ncbi:hypothetical protein KDN24_21295 [Bacillus sp. Bva_UNVM-123]|uniref:hypothetical protein n=1 Tax=Bacillus sp. Bva_UNVM-123 TaxID=2829798 RepID=UPI00391F5025